MKTLSIHGKQYAPVNERLKAFRSDHPDWSLQTSILERSESDVLMQCVISDETGRVIATGIAYEVKGSSNINKTSHIENCETSAAGRALAMMGYGIDGSIASAEEVEGVDEAAVKQKVIKPKRSTLNGYLKEHGVEEVTQFCKVNGIATQAQANALLKDMGALNDMIERFKDD